MFILISIFIWAMFAAGSAAVADRRGSSGVLWFGLGVLLGPFGFLLAYLSSGKRCAHCKSRIHQNAIRCPYCQRRLYGLGTRINQLLWLFAAFAGILLIGYSLGYFIG